jgi:hypothetical protein
MMIIDLNIYAVTHAKELSLLAYILIILTSDRGGIGVVFLMFRDVLLRHV